MIKGTHIQKEYLTFGDGELKQKILDKYSEKYVRIKQVEICFDCLRYSMQYGCSIFLLPITSMDIKCPYQTISEVKVNEQNE